MNSQTPLPGVGMSSVTHYADLAQQYAWHRRVHPEVLRDLLQQSGIDAQSRVLEVGCGVSLSAIVWNRFGLESALEQSPRAIRAGIMGGQAVPVAWNEAGVTTWSREGC